MALLLLDEKWALLGCIQSALQCLCVPSCACVVCRRQQQQRPAHCEVEEEKELEEDDEFGRGSGKDHVSESQGFRPLAGPCR